MTSWSLTASNGGAFTTLLTKTGKLGGTAAQDFPVTIPAGTAYSIYRITALGVEAGTTDTGLQLFQIFTRNI
jgi:hypothetical protein